MNPAPALWRDPRTRLIHDWLVKRPRFHLHFTPTSASWLNLVECWFALLSRRRLERAAFTSVGDLEEAIHAYIAETNAEPKPFIWTKTADDILGSIARFCLRTSNSGHSVGLGNGDGCPETARRSPRSLRSWSPWP